MTTETRQRIKAYKRRLPELRERVIAVALLFAMSASMLGTASYAWLTLSRAPEITGMSTTVAANGNLEIALAQGLTSEELKPPEESEVGDSAAAQGITEANITWGNLINLSDPIYGINNISLRPAVLNGSYLNERPLRGAHFGEDGRVMYTTDEYTYSSWALDSAGKGYFDARNINYGVRAISSVKYANVSSSKELENFKINISNQYGSAQKQYVALITGNTWVNKAKTISGMDALRDMIQMYAQDQVDDKFGDSPAKNDYSGSVTYFHNLMGQFMDILKAEGEGLRYIVNRKIYMETGANANHFETVEEMLSLSKTALEALLKDGDTVQSFESFKNNYNALKVYFDENNQIYKLAKAYDPDNPEITIPSEPVPWAVISPAVECMVDIDETRLNGNKITELADAPIGDLVSLLTKSSHDVIINAGALKDTEQRICDSTMTMKAKNVNITIKLINLPVVNSKNILAYVSTTATTPPTYQLDDKVDGSASIQGTDPVAKDTYGMAIDMWMRTNAQNSFVTLEGQVVYGEPEPVYVKDLNGNDTELYALSGENILTEAYKMDDVWYYADSHLAIETELLTDVTTAQVTESKIIGYEGENRIWENESEVWEDMVHSGHIAQDRTTQGSGSCFVYYADPAQQENMTEMLKSLSIVFADGSGNQLGTASLDVDKSYSINGKITVPIKLISGQKYTYQDENGQDVTEIGIIQLPQNVAQKITAIIYLNGTELTNENVLSSGEIQGQLNLQFGNNISMTSINDSELQQEYRTITAVATYGDEVSTDESSPINGDGQGLLYDGKSKSVRVTLTVEGEQPSRISGGFVRSINATQGSKEESKNFVMQQNGTWIADFDLTMPGEYKLQSLIVDGSEYNLMRKVEVSGVQTTVPAYPTVIIYGLNIANVSVTDSNGKIMPSGMYMTTDDSIDAIVSVQIAAADSLKPKQVRAVFDGKQSDSTAILTYDSTSDKWVGTARITSSDTYTLNKIAIDGKFSDINGPTYVVSLGMSAQVWAHPEKVKEEYGGPFESTSFEFTDPVAFPISAEIRDNGGAEKGNLSGKIEIFYHDGTGVDENGLHTELKWDSDLGRYTGIFAIEKPGRYTFNRIVITEEGKTPNTIRRASLAAVFAPTSPYLPTYYGERMDTLETEGKQVNLDGGAAVVACIADASVVNARLVQLDAEGKVVYSKIVRGEETTTTEQVTTADNRNTDAHYYTFQIPDGTYENQNGIWKINRLYFQQVFMDGEFIDETAVEDVTEDNSYSFAVNGDTTYVVASLTPVLKRGESLYTGESLGIEDNEINATFMTPQPIKPVTIHFLDWAQKEVPTSPIAAVKWSLAYKANSSDIYGGYSLGSAETPDTYKEITAVNGIFTSPSDLSLSVAGEYTSTVQIKINGDEVWRDIKAPASAVKIAVWSMKPYVKFTATNPAVGEKFDVKIAGKDDTEKLSNSISTDGFSATIYFRAVKIGFNCGQYASSLTATLYGCDQPFEKASCKVVSNGTGSDIEFEFTSSDKSSTKDVGSASGSTIYPLGKNAKATTLTIDGYSITLNNPLYVTNER